MYNYVLKAKILLEINYKPGLFDEFTFCTETHGMFDLDKEIPSCPLHFQKTVFHTKTF